MTAPGYRITTGPTPEFITVLMRGGARLHFAKYHPDSKYVGHWSCVLRVPLGGRMRRVGPNGRGLTVASAYAAWKVAAYARYQVRWQEATV